MRHFSALVNVRELEMDHPDIHRFMPRIRRCFENFLPTLRSLALKEPKWSRRQVLYFIGLFQHLEDPKLQLSDHPPEPVDGLSLIPLFAPLPRSGLAMTFVSNLNFLKDMDLFNVKRVRFGAMLARESWKHYGCIRALPFEPQSIPAQIASDARGPVVVCPRCVSVRVTGYHRETPQARRLDHHISP